MKKLIAALAFVLLAATQGFAAPFLGWDPVTTAPDGTTLGVGEQVIDYKVYSCGTSVPGCATATKVLIATIVAPATQMDLAGKQTPIVYTVTARNIVGESAYSVPFKVTPPDVPKNLHINP